MSREVGTSKHLHRVRKTFNDTTLTPKLNQVKILCDEQDIILNNLFELIIFLLTLLIMFESGGVGYI